MWNVTAPLSVPPSSSFLSSEKAEDGPPEPITSDYVEMAMLLLLFIFGAPLNLAAYTQLAERSVQSRLEILKRHLNFTDLLVVFIFVPSRALWLLTYDWRGGDLICKLVKFLHTFAFQSSSNVIVCIALDRLFSVLFPSHQSPHRAHQRTRIMLATAWLIAAVISIPQLLIWQDFLAYEDANWSQCIQMWHVSRVRAAREGAEPPSLLEERLYSAAHVLLVYWLPAAIVLFSYVLVLWWVYLNSQPSSFCHLSGQRTSLQTTCETAETVLSKVTNSLPRVYLTINSSRLPFTNYIEDVSSDWHRLSTQAKVAIREEKPYPGQPRLIVTTTAEVESEQVGKTTRPSTGSVAGLPPNVGSNSVSYQARISRSRAIRISFLLVAAYFICWLPYNLVSLLQISHAEWAAPFIRQMYWLNGLVVFNSVINPYLYGFFGPVQRRRTGGGVDA